MAYQAWSVVFGEQPTASKWNILGTNDESFHDGTGIDDDAILQRHIADDQILPAQLTSAARWWEELGRTTLGSTSSSISVTGLANRKFLRVLFNVSSASNTRALLRFNNVSSAAYSWASLSQAAGVDSATSATGLDLYNVDTVQTRTGELCILNVSTLEKVAIMTNINPGTAGAGNAVGFRTVAGKWADTSNVISRIDIVTASNTFAAGSEIVVLGHN